MKPAPFEYIIARSLDQALAAKSEYGDEARFLAGGQSLVPTMNFRLSQPAVLIDINPLDELSGIQDGDGIEVRSKTSKRRISADAFFVAALETALRPDEMLVEIMLPDHPPRTGVCF